MFTSVSPHMVVALVFGMIAPLSAQNLANTSRPSSEGSVLPSHHAVPAVEAVKGVAPKENPAQDAPTLGRKPSLYRKFAVSKKLRPYEIEADSLQKGLERMSAVYRESGKPAKGAN